MGWGRVVARAGGGHSLEPATAGEKGAVGVGAGVVGFRVLRARSLL